MAGDPHRHRERRGGRLGTVRFRITVLAALVVLAVLAAIGTGLVAVQRRVLTDSLDEALGQEAAAVAAAWAQGTPGTLAPVGDDDAVAQVVVDGRVARATANARGAAPLVTTTDADRHDDGRARTVRGAPTDAGGRFRLVTRAVDGPGGAAVVAVAAPVDDIDESVDLLARSLAVAVPVAALLLAALVWWLVGRTLQPVEAVRREAAAIDGTEPDRRVPVPPGDDEIARLARTLNGMLDRIAAAGRRQQRFVADASHELRSPLARMRTELEVDLAHPAGADPAATQRSVLEETVGMQALVDDLLVLARLDAGPRAAGGPRRPVDLDEVVAREVQRARPDGRVAVDVTGVDAVQVVGDAAHLGRAVGNVVDNAVRHARSQVTVTLGERGGRAELAVADDGPGIPADRRHEVFERFTRLDGARSVAAGGTGLGLAIAREIVVDHGGTIAIDPDHGPGARLVVSLPLASR